MVFENLRTFDASLVVADVFKDLKISDYRSYFSVAMANGRINALVPKQLLRILESAVPVTAQPEAAVPATEAESAEEHSVEDAAHRREATDS